MKIYMGKEDERGTAPEYLPIEQFVVHIDTGEVITGAVLLDKEGNPTEIFFDAMTLLGRNQEGEWYEVSLVDQVYEKPTIH